MLWWFLKKAYPIKSILCCIKILISLCKGCHSTDKTLVKNKCSLVLEFPSSTATDDYYCNLVSTKTPGLIRSVQAGKRDQLCHHFIDTLPIDPFNATCQYKGGNTIQIGKNSTRWVAAQANARTNSTATRRKRGLWILKKGCGEWWELITEKGVAMSRSHGAVCSLGQSHGLVWNPEILWNFQAHIDRCVT